MHLTKQATQPSKQFYRIGTRLLPLLLIFSALSFADIVPVVWTGTPTGTIDCGSCEYGTAPSWYESQNGPEADVSETYSTGVFQKGNYQTGGSVSTPFTITSEAQIELTVAADYYSQGSTCAPFNCAPMTAWIFAGQFSGSSEIVDAQGNVDLSLSWGASGSTPANCDPFDCIAGLSLASDVSGSVDLAAGTYTVLNFEENSNQSIGDNQSSVGVTEALTDPDKQLVPTPEPVGESLAVVGLVGILLLLRRSGTHRPCMSQRLLSLAITLSDVRHLAALFLQVMS